MRRPCSKCPWRKDAPRGHWHPDHFVSIWYSCQGEGLNVMLCHKATKLPEAKRGKLVCQGWVRVLGFDAIGVRIAAAQGNVTVEEVNDADGPKLFRSFAAMLKANKIPVVDG